jgi:Leucine-rich repeat (LRR) protein
VLDVSNNRVSELQGVEKLHLLTDLWLNDNLIASLDRLLSASQSPTGASLTCLYLHGNPASQDSAAYRGTVLHMFPNLQQLDDDIV